MRVRTVCHSVCIDRDISLKLILYGVCSTDMQCLDGLVKTIALSKVLLLFYIIVYKALLSVLMCCYLKRYVVT